MKFSPLRLALLLATCAGLLSGCVSTGGYYEGGDYYESYGEDYGYWGPSYYVVPFHAEGHHRDEDRRRVEDHRPARGDGHDARTYRLAPASRPTPSIPSRPRSGGSRSRSIPEKR